ncbi:MAG: hypothetical protein E7159_05405 [Firmicutes bacterium]|jgi:hypothetical protein|nr:hypothetical protein [Bacillota bacterium]
MALTYREPDYTITLENYTEENEKYHTEQIRSVHSVEKGWFVGEPERITRSDGSVTLVYDLQKFDSEEEARQEYAKNGIDLDKAKEIQQFQGYSR